MVIALLMVIVGGICIAILPIVPPAVQVTSQFIDASSDVVAKTVTTLLERNINGVEGMIYMSSASTNAGNSSITITFNVGYDVDIGEVDVLNSSNRVNALLPKSASICSLSRARRSSRMITSFAG